MATSAIAGDADHQHRLEREVGGVQEPERGAGVLHVRDVEEPGDDRHVIVEVERAPDDCLRQLIERRSPRRS